MSLVRSFLSLHFKKNHLIRLLFLLNPFAKVFLLKFPCPSVTIFIFRQFFSYHPFSITFYFIFFFLFRLSKLPFWSFVHLKAIIRSFPLVTAVVKNGKLFVKNGFGNDEVGFIASEIRCILNHDQQSFVNFTFSALWILNYAINFFFKS